MIERLQAKRNSEEGFTLIELLIVIIVLGILAAIVVFAVSGTKKDAVEATCATDKASIELSAESVLAKKAGALVLTDVASADLTNPANGGLLKSMPTSSNYTLAWDQATGTVTVSHPTDATVNSCDDLGS